MEENTEDEIQTMPDLHIRVQSLFGHNLEVTINASKRILDLKKEIAKRKGIRPQNFHLVFNMQATKDHETLHDVGVIEGSTLDIIVALQGGERRKREVGFRAMETVSDEGFFEKLYKVIEEARGKKEMRVVFTRHNAPGDTESPKLVFIVNKTEHALHLVKGFQGKEGLSTICTSRIPLVDEDEEPDSTASPSDTDDETDDDEEVNAATIEQEDARMKDVLRLGHTMWKLYGAMHLRSELRELRRQKRIHAMRAAANVEQTVRCQQGEHTKTDIFPVAGCSTDNAAGLVQGAEVSDGPQSTPQDIACNAVANDGAAKEEAGSACKLKMLSSRGKKRVRCEQCNRRVNIVYVQTCRCNGLFCKEHRLPEAHRCTYDYRAEGRKEIARNNPRVVGAKIEKI